MARSTRRWVPFFERWSLRVTAGATLAILLLPYGTAAARVRRWARPRAALHRDASEAFVASVAQVVVRRGDTLWDLCARYTGKPWVWPQIWAQNPQLTNPHWLEVGTVLQLQRTAGGAPAVASQLVPPPTGAAASAAGQVATSATGTAPDAAGQGPSGAGGSAGAPGAGIGPLRPNLRQAIVARATLRRLPRVRRTVGESELGHIGQPLAVQAGEGAVVRAHEAYVTLAEQAEVPGLGQSADGVLVSVTGIVEPQLVDRRSEVVVRHLYAEVEGGQWLAPLADYVVPPQAPRQAPELRSQVLGVQDGALVAGGAKLAFVASGRAQGLAPGMRLWLMDAEEIEAPPGAKLVAPRPAGELVVLQVQQDHSTCAIAQAAHEVTRGQRVVGGPRPAP